MRSSQVALKKALTAASRGAGPSRLFDTAWSFEHSPEKRRSGFKAFPRPKTFKSRSALSTEKGTIRRPGGPPAPLRRALSGRSGAGGTAGFAPRFAFSNQDPRAGNGRQIRPLPPSGPWQSRSLPHPAVLGKLLAMSIALCPAAGWSLPALSLSLAR